MPQKNKLNLDIRQQGSASIVKSDEIFISDTVISIVKTLKDKTVKYSYSFPDGKDIKYIDPYKQLIGMGRDSEGMLIGVLVCQKPSGQTENVVPKNEVPADLTKLAEGVKIYTPDPKEELEAELAKIRAELETEIIEEGQTEKAAKLRERLKNFKAQNNLK